MESIPSSRESRVRVAARWLLAVLFVVAGVSHFLRTEELMRIVPPSLPAPRLLVWISGVAEIVLGVLVLIPRTRRLAGWGLVALLIAVFPANVYLYQHQEIYPAPPALHLARLPFQAVLIAWAWLVTRPAGESRSGSSVFGRFRPKSP